ncbi:MAG: ankyrin repeat domain-containing protein [Clostridiales Family XIII bacterium]|jgi:hypothetical protein|nr:ankyrin repeat domain-containing protein [Clostridiales Family XIII bacterium]
MDKTGDIWRKICDTYGITDITAFRRMTKLRIEMTEASVAMICMHKTDFLPALEALLSSCGEAELTEDDAMGTNAIMWAAAGYLTFEKLSVLERLHPDFIRAHIRDADSDGWTPLHYLAGSGEDRPESVKFLVDRGVDIDARCFAYGRTALHEFAAKQTEAERSVARLLDYEPELYCDKEGDDPMWTEFRFSGRVDEYNAYEGSGLIIKYTHTSGKKVHPYRPVGRTGRRGNKNR